MPLLGWWHPTFLPPEARIALLRSRASALTSADSSASHSPEAPRATAQPAGGTFHLYHAAIRLAVHQPGYCHSLGLQISKGHFVPSPGVSEMKPHFKKEVVSCSEHAHAEREGQRCCLANYRFSFIAIKKKNLTWKMKSFLNSFEWEDGLLWSGEGHLCGLFVMYWDKGNHKNSCLSLTIHEDGWKSGSWPRATVGPAPARWLKRPPYHS